MAMRTKKIVPPDYMETMYTAAPGRALRYLADSYEQAQRIRIEAGERIRAVLQGRDDTWSLSGAVPSEKPAPIERAGVPEKSEQQERAAESEHPGGNQRAETREHPEDNERAAEKEETETPERDDETEAILAGIAKGEILGPIPILGRTYWRHYQEERELYHEMMTTLELHPAWAWMQQVKGIGATLGCKLLARLDVTKAQHASSFWAYCGLATVPGTQYQCPDCGLERVFPVDFNVSGKHQALGTTRNCKSLLVMTRTAAEGARAAQPRSARGVKAPYDSYAKKVCYLVGLQFEKLGERAPYAEYYRRELAKLEREKPGWAKGRRRFTALRKVEKLFLSHLWLIWREAEGLPTSTPYAVQHHGAETFISPWEMIGPSKKVVA